MRTNLLQRLKPEFKVGLENSKLRYPEVIDRIEHLLGQHLFYGDLTIDQVKRIFLFSDVESHNRSGWDWRFGEDMFTLCNDVC
jgi:hypothetical protein